MAFVRERGRRRRQRRVLEVLDEARGVVLWVDSLLPRLEVFLDAVERERVRRAVVAGQVRACLIPARVSGTASVFWFVWPALAVVGVAMTAFALVAALGLLPYLASGVVVGGRRVSLAFAVVGAAFVGGLAVPTWPRISQIARDIWEALWGRGEVGLEEWARVLGSVGVAAGALYGVVDAVLIASGPGWGVHGRIAIGLGCGLAAGVSGRLWDRWAFAAAERLLGDRPRERADDRALHALFVCALVNAQLLQGSWRTKPTVRRWRSFLASYAAYARSPQAVTGQTRWFEYRERALVRRRYRMLAEILEEHGNRTLAARTRRDWERMCQSLVSGLVLLADGDWDGLLAHHGSFVQRERWVARYGPRVATAAITGAAAVLLPLLPGVSAAADASIRVFLGVGAVLALLPGTGSYDPVRGALASSLGWKAGR